MIIALLQVQAQTDPRRWHRPDSADKKSPPGLMIAPAHNERTKTKTLLQPERRDW